ncbi:hypothetical protein I6A84_07025 [Frankia sp. CNm7]|uniref:Uncharacterized protein n=1 Tax=Frankia nepalensis TaxID=1836974 RepID=A0A937USD6_9ACTN|nr:hypothetical protein [Frankia nepalensis]MBL7513496.1 hypothetical protein [Frankia nepalensis]MBL7517881.1 hypothetical protein [Frankia nepalensis]MBL7628771.1 hypothetical protein [Frankia nepalensis]
MVCVVGPDPTASPDTVTRSVVAPLASAANVTLVLPDDTMSPGARAAAAWRECRGVATPYVVHDADPLAEVAAAWTARYDEAGAVGDLEVAVAAAADRFRRGEVDMPDSLVLLDPDGWPPTRRHWYLGVLAAAAPARVVPVRSDSRELRRALRALPAGRWWPDPPERLLDGIDRVVPDRVGLPTRG